MKILITFFLSLFLILNSFSQEMFEWTEPVPLTDSNSFNSNPFVWVNEADVSIMFYEKKLESTSNSMIYVTELNGDDIEYPLLSSDEVSYRLPSFISSYYFDRVGFLFFLADVNGKFELFATEYMADGSLDKTFIVATEDTDIEKYSISNYNYWIGWNSGGNIYAGNIDFIDDSVFVNEITKLDSLNCSNVVIGAELAAWEKQLGDSVSVNYSEYLYNSETQENEWTAPVEIDRSKNEPDLNIDHSVFGDQFNILIWIDDDQIKAFDAAEKEVMPMESYNLSYPKHPSGYFWFMAVKNSLPDLFYLCFDSEQEEDREIYCLQTDWGLGDTVRITNNNVNDVNPELFSGEISNYPFYSEYVYCIWQSDRNGKLPLYMSKSKAIVGSDVNENKAERIAIEVSPNPFSKSIQISFEMKSSAQANLLIFSTEGRLVQKIELDEKSNSIQQVSWQPGPEIPKGLYLITINQNGKSSSTKVLYR